MMTDLVKVIPDMLRNPSLRRVDEFVPRFPKLVCEIVEHPCRFFHRFERVMVGRGWTGQLEPARLACGPESKCAVVENGERVGGHIWDCERLLMVIRS